MAGIGFELRKLFKEKGLIAGFRAWFYSALITIGPMLLCILLLTVLQVFMSYLGIDFNKKELFTVTIIYSFIFSLILTSGFSMLLSRYISDKIYKKEEKDIIPSLKGAITILMILGGIIGIVFYYNSPLNFSYKVVAYILFMELNILWIQTIYVTGLRKYKKILRGFFVGIFAGILLSAILVGYLKLDAVMGSLISVDIGFFIILLFFFNSIQDGGKHSNRNYFGFLEYLDKYPSLFFISFIYTLGLYIHNLVFWGGEHQKFINGTYIFAPIYDMPVFWAFLSIIPAIVIFAVTFETFFYEKYKLFYDSILENGTKKVIDKSKHEMKIVLFQQLRHVMGVQLVFTGICLVLGKILLPKVEFFHQSIQIFNVLVIGYYAFVVMFIILSILLYFDDRIDALLLVLIFTSLNGLFTGLTTIMGEAYFGFGFLVSAFIALLFGILRLKNFIKNIDYHIFCSQPLINIERERVFTRISRKLQRVLVVTKKSAI